MDNLKTNKIKTGNIIFGDDDLPLIAGPCVIESRDHTLKMAEGIRKITDELGYSLIFKASYDKANRTGINDYRGPGMETGLKILEEVRSRFEIPILTDIHQINQAGPTAEVADILQIPAFLCRQTDLLLAAGETGKPVNVKKGQFLSPWKVPGIVNKIESTGNNNILMTERGSSFGYGLIADMRSIEIMKMTGYPVIFDAGHSVQRSGWGEEKTSGCRDFIPTLAKSAVAAGCHGIFLEVHDDVENALSDSATQWPLNRLSEFLKPLKRIYEAQKND